MLAQRPAASTHSTFDSKLHCNFSFTISLPETPPSLLRAIGTIFNLSTSNLSTGDIQLFISVGRACSLVLCNLSASDFRLIKSSCFANFHVSLLGVFFHQTLLHSQKDLIQLLYLYPNYRFWEILIHILYIRFINPNTNLSIQDIIYHIFALLLFQI